MVDKTKKKKKIYKFEVTVELEITNIRRFMSAFPTRRTLQARYQTPPEIEEDFDNDEDRFVRFVMEAVHTEAENIPGIGVQGLSAHRVTWFDHDCIVDRRHPDFKPFTRRKTVNEDSDSAEEGRA